MRRIEIVIPAIALVGALSWAVAAGSDGFKGSNAMIVSRGTTIISTIDGVVQNEPPLVGDRVNSSEVLARIHNARIDRSRLIDLESEIRFLETEIRNAEEQQRELSELLEHYSHRNRGFSTWMLKDMEFRRAEYSKKLAIAEQQSKVKSSHERRVSELFNKQHMSSEALINAKADAKIAQDEYELTRTQHERSQVLLNTARSDGVFSEDGEASYWQEMVDTLRLRHLDNLTNVSTLHAQLARTKEQFEVEEARIGFNVNEEHVAPFSGLVNAAFVSKDTRVAAGTSLFHILDCSNPIVIIPLPEHRISEFSVGMRVTIYPIDTTQAIPGSIKYVTSGPLIGYDKTLQVQQDLTLNGVKAVVTLEQDALVDPVSCEAVHKAVAIIHTETLFESVSRRISATWT